MSHSGSPMDSAMDYNSEIPITFESHYKLSNFLISNNPEGSIQRILDSRGWRMRSSKSERRVYWFQLTANEGDWFLQVNLNTRETKKIETEAEFIHLSNEEEAKYESDREFKYIKFQDIPRFWIREKTNSSREVLPLNKNDFGEFIKCCSLYYGNCSSNGHCFSFYEIPQDKSCVCDEGEEDKIVRLKKQPFKRPAIIADHVGECLRFKGTGFGELCKIKKGWAQEDRDNGVGDDLDDDEDRPKKNLPKRKGSGKPPMIGKSKKPKFENPVGF
jgi:hypothetical protein